MAGFGFASALNNRILPSNLPFAQDKRSNVVMFS